MVSAISTARRVVVKNLEQVWSSSLALDRAECGPKSACLFFREDPPASRRSRNCSLTRKGIFMAQQVKAVSTTPVLSSSLVRQYREVSGRKPCFTVLERLAATELIPWRVWLLGRKGLCLEPLSRAGSLAEAPFSVCSLPPVLGDCGATKSYTILARLPQTEPHLIP